MHGRVVVLSLCVLGCSSPSPAPAGACPIVAGDWRFTGALRSDTTCTFDGGASVIQSSCAIEVYSAGTGPEGGTPIFACTLDRAGHCTATAGGTVRIDVALSATSGMVTYTEALSGVVCPSPWRR